MIDMPDVIFFSLVMMRMSGFILLNPIFGRRNVPAFVKAGLVMVLSIFLYSLSPNKNQIFEVGGTIGYGFLLLKEFSIGFALGFIMDLFFYITSYAGGLIDFNMGMSMANIYDPQTNASMPLTGSILNTMMIMLFFAVDGHLALIKIFMQSEQVLPYTQAMMTPQSISVILDIFKECTLLAVKLSFPIMAFELLGEVSVGILMKVIPQINVFVVNIQTKVLIGNLLMLLLCVPMGAFLSDAVDMMVQSVSRFLLLL